MLDSGIYIVTLTNQHPISVNAHDPRIAERCIKVTAANCKLGRAKSLRARERSYWRTFGKEYVVFRPIALMDGPQLAERVILTALRQWRIPGRSGRHSEWLQGVSAADAERIAREAMRAAQIQHHSCTL